MRHCSPGLRASVWAACGRASNRTNEFTESPNGFTADHTPIRAIGGKNYFALPSGMVVEIPPAEPSPVPPLAHVFVPHPSRKVIQKRMKAPMTSGRAMDFMGAIMIILNRE
jgi:hypothetical protein